MVQQDSEELESFVVQQDFAELESFGIQQDSAELKSLGAQQKSGDYVLLRKDGLPGLGRRCQGNCSAGFMR